jgi:hypothetical protein
MRTYVIASVLIILGLISVAYKGSLHPGDWKLPYLTDLSSALFVGGLLSLLFKLFLDKEKEANLRRLMRIHDSVDELGLSEIKSESQGFNFTELVETADDLSIIINDGLRWVGNNSVALQNRFGKRSLTEVFTVDPDSTFVDSLSAKVSMTKDDINKKIKDNWKRLGDIHAKSEGKGTLRIFRLKTYPTRTMFITENQLIETPYQIASGRANIPLFVYHRVPRQDSVYEFARHDLEQIRKEATLEKEYPNEAPEATR